MPLDTLQLILATQIALLRKWMPFAEILPQIESGLGLARKAMLDAEIAEDLGTYKMISDAILNRILSMGEWAAAKAEDKNLTGGQLNVAAGSGVVSTYTVPAGKKLYVTDMGFYIIANLTADGDLNQMGYCSVSLAGSENKYLGGNGGNAVSFRKPIVYEDGDILWYGIVNESNHACDIGMFVSGYEV